MAKIDILRRFISQCFTPTTTTSTPAPTSSLTTSTTVITTKKRLSTSLRADLDEPKDQEEEEDDHDSSTTDDASVIAASDMAAPPRISKTMVIGTIFGRRRGHVWFCVQNDRLSTKPCLLLELSIPTHLLVQEMRCGLVRIALECNESPGSEISRCPLHSVPFWTMFCNGRKLGFAVRRKATRENRLMLKTMRSTTVGAGAIPSGLVSGSEGNKSGELMYMRANYECVVGSSDSESFHLINPDGCPGQELSVFLLRSR